MYRAPGPVSRAVRWASQAQKMQLLVSQLGKAARDLDETREKIAIRVAEGKSLIAMKEGRVSVDAHFRTYPPPETSRAAKNMVWTFDRLSQEVGEYSATRFSKLSGDVERLCEREAKDKKNRDMKALSLEDAVAKGGSGLRSQVSLNPTHPFLVHLRSLGMKWMSDHCNAVKQFAATKPAVARQNKARSQFGIHLRRHLITEELATFDDAQKKVFRDIAHITESTLQLELRNALDDVYAPMAEQKQLMNGLQSSVSLSADIC